MPSPYSNDLRIRVIQAIKSEKQSKPRIAQHFSVSTHFVYTLWAHYQETGCVSQPQADRWIHEVYSGTLMKIIVIYANHAQELR